VIIIIIIHYFLNYSPNADLKEVDRSQTNSSGHKFTWKVNGWTKEDEGKNPKTNTATSLAAKHVEGNPFFVELKAKLYNPHCDQEQQFHQIDLQLIVSHGHHNITGSIDEVICSIAIPDNNTILIQPVKMTEKPSHDKKLLQVFYIEDFPRLIACPFVITFNVKLRSSVLNYINKIMDSNWSQDLWDTAVNRKMTDVEILVGEDAFGAHRSLLSTRSPVFAAMFASGMKEAECGQVRIEDVDPVVFQSFLKFLYTGMFEPSAIDKELFTIADKYQVDTLAELCRPASASQTVDTESIIKTFFSS